MNFKRLLFIFLLFFCFLLMPYKRAFAQDFTNRGKDFWLSHMGHIDGNGSTLILYISASVNTSGTVSVPLQGWSTTYTAAANTMVMVTVPSNVGYVGCSDCLQQKGIHIVADNDIAVHAQIYAPARADGSLILPTKVLGKEYYTIEMTQFGGYHSEFIIVAVEDSTIVEITPTANTLGGNPSGVTFTVTLQQGEVYQVQSAIDLTGSKVATISNGNEACKKIAVFAGSTWNSPGCNGAGTGDNFFEQMYPTNTWGKHFVTSPLMSRQGGDLYRVMADSNNTTVVINGNTKSLNAGEYFDTIFTTASFFSADKPIALAEYARSGSCDGVTGDPFEIVLNPIEQTVTNVLLYSTNHSSITGEYINIVMKTADVNTFTLDGSAVSFSPVPSNPTYSYSQNSVSVGVHSLVADSGFNAIAYGFGSPEAYGYLAGANVKNLDVKMKLTDISVCEGTNIGFEGSATYVPVSWKWYFGDGDTSSLQNEMHTYADTGTYTVSLVTIKPSVTGCDAKDSITSTVKVLGVPVANFNAAGVCFGDSSMLIDVSTTPKGGIINKWSWVLGDNNLDTLQNVAHKYATCDTFSVSLLVISDNGCRDSISKTARVFCLPTANYSVNEVCRTQTTVFIDSSLGNISAWDWRLGDTSISATPSPSHVYSTCGTFNAKLIVTTNDGCKDSITKITTVNCLPVASFGFAPVCLFDSTHFSDSSTISTGNIVNTIWDFGDGSSISLQQNPGHVYANPGTNLVSLVAISNRGCLDTIIQSVVVHPLPQVLFGATNVCDGEAILFSDSSSILPTDTISAHLWNYGDGSTLSTAQNSTHTYSTFGTYNVKLVVSSAFGCIDSLSSQAVVYPNPIANFSSTNVCWGFNTIFSDSSVTPNGSIVSWAWNFGDMDTSSNQNPEHLYAVADSHFVSLIVSNNYGCSDTVQHSTFVYYQPEGDFFQTNICVSSSMSFVDSSAVGASNIVVWSWGFGDGSGLSAFQNPTYQYDSAGLYGVNLIVTSGNGCNDTVAKNVIVHPLPVVNFNLVNVCLGDSTLFASASSIAPSDTLATWLWNFGDNNSFSNTMNTSYLYADTGFYLVQLKVTSTFGCIDSITKVSVVNPNPVVDFVTLDTLGCEPLCVVFQNNSFVSSGSISSFLWTFGDNSNTSNLENVTHCYTNDSVFTPIYYAPNLTVTSNFGCVSSATKNDYVLVYPAPDAAFSASPATVTITNPEVVITDMSLGTTNWSWSFGDNDTSSLPSPGSHTFADTGRYQMTLIASTQYNCKDTSYQTVIVEPDFMFYIPSAFSPNDDNINDTFIGTGMFIKEFEMSIFDRWGNLIYKTNSLDKPWDGKANAGKEFAQQDVYIYSIKLTDFQLTKRLYKGTVTLLH